jgi:hypothetical protein
LSFTLTDSEVEALSEATTPTGKAPRTGRGNRRHA